LILSNPEEGLTPSTIKDNMRNSGYTSMAVGLALEGLRRQQMVELYDDTDEHGYTYKPCRLTLKGTNWLLDNQDKFRMARDEGTGVKQQKATSTPISDEDIPSESGLQPPDLPLLPSLITSR
jgi:predicted transcriptional regulator